MQKKLIALAVAGLSTAAFAQTNVTIYGVADVSAQGTNMTSHTARGTTNSGTLDANNDFVPGATYGTGKVPAGGSFNLKNNSSLIGFKGTEDLGNGLKGLFQIETNVNLTGGSAVAAGNGSTWGSMRDSYVGLNSKFGTVLGGYLSTPFRSTLTSFDVMPGATGDGRIENMLGKIRMGGQSFNFGPGSTGYVQADSSVRATALAYAMPTLYGFNGSIAYTGSGNNGGSNQTSMTWTGSAESADTTSGKKYYDTNLTSQTNVAPQSALALALGWEGYGVAIKGAFQQAKVNQSLAYVGSTAFSNVGTTNSTGVTVPYTSSSMLDVSGYTSYLIGASYTGVPGLKASVVYNRNTVGMNGNGQNIGASKGSNNALYVGASYRFGNNEPRLSYQNVSNTSGLSGTGYTAQDGANQWTANWGYYLSKRTQVYGIVSTIKNNQIGTVNMASGGTSLVPTGGQVITTYGAGMRTNF